MQSSIPNRQSKIANPKSLAVVICTRNRPDDLARCLASLAAQTRPADEVWVIDASDQPLADGSQPFNLQPATLNFIPTAPGLPAQRNLALRHTQTDVAAFFDDDVELAPDYLAALMAVYEQRWDEGIGGVMGCDPGWRQSSGGAHWLKRLFGLTHVRAHGNRVRVSPALGVAWVARPSGEIPCDAMPGYCMSFRRAALDAVATDGEWFDESLGGYADGEDIDVAIRVGRMHPLWQTPAARLTHHRSRADRASLRRRFMTRTRNERYLHRKLMPTTLRYRLAWGWSVAGRLLVAASVCVSQRTLAPLLGTLDGLRY